MAPQPGRRSAIQTVLTCVPPCVQFMDVLQAQTLIQNASRGNRTASASKERIPMSDCLLAPDVYLCITEDAAVFLDLGRNQYVGLEATYLPVLRSVMTSENPGTLHTEELVDKLREAGLVCDDQRNGRPLIPTSVEVADTLLVPMDADVTADVRSHVRPHHIANLFISYALASLSFRLCSLKRAVRRVETIKNRKARSGDTALDLDAARRLVQIFEYLRPLLYTSQDKCLLDSLTLIEFLARYDVFPTWILGVRTGPFRAHSWVQHSRYVFNDSPGHTRAYVPILAI